VTSRYRYYPLWTSNSISYCQIPALSQDVSNNSNAKCAENVKNIKKVVDFNKIQILLETQSALNCCRLTNSAPCGWRAMDRAWRSWEWGKLTASTCSFHFWNGWLNTQSVWVDVVWCHLTLRTHHIATCRLTDSVGYQQRVCRVFRVCSVFRVCRVFRVCSVFRMFTVSTEGQAPVLICK